jgi:putative thioredoxin
VRQWVANLNPPPREVDRLIAAGDEASLRRAVELEPANDAALLALAALLIGQPASDRAEQDSRRSEALALLARMPESAETRHLAAQARLGADNPDGASPSSDGVEGKLDALLDRVKDDDGARQEFVDLLEVLGPDDPRTAAYRKALTARLF